MHTDKPDLYQAAMDYLKEIERKNMENQKLYLSITLDSDTNNYEIKLHASACFDEWIAKGIVKRIRIYNSECFKTIHMCNIENMVNKIYELLEKTSNMIYYLMGETPNMQSKSISLNTAYVITIDYFNHEEYRTMWDVTDLCNPEKIENIEYDCGCCGICEDDEEDEELAKAKTIVWHFDFDHIYDDLCEIKQQIKKLNNDMDIYYKELISLHAQVYDLNDSKNDVQSVFDDHEKRINNLENNMIKSMMFHYFNNDKSPHSGDRK